MDEPVVSGDNWPLSAPGSTYVSHRCAILGKSWRRGKAVVTWANAAFPTIHTPYYHS